MPRVLVSALSLLLLLSATLAARAARPAADDPVITELDAHIQRRFLEAENRFGMGRMLPPADRHSVVLRFRPENEAEERTIADLERSRTKVALYLAGRRLLTSRPLRAASGATDAAAARLSSMRRVLEGPVVVSPSAPGSITDAPGAAALVDDAVEAFEVFETGGVAEAFERDGWSIVARPVRAAAERCLRCHRQDAAGRSVKLGDVLGVVLYAHQPGGAR